MGLTDEEVREVMHVAMTVGASRVQVLADAELGRLEPQAAPPADGTRVADVGRTDGDQTTGGGFAAAAVEAQADGG